MEITITMKKIAVVSKTYEVTEEEFLAIKNGENPFYDELVEEVKKEDFEYDYSVCDEDGNVVVDFDD